MSTAEDRQQKPCGNADCDKCVPKPRWRIAQHRIQHITYAREIKAATAEEALKIFDGGTAWPSSYDDRYGEIVQQDEPMIEQITGGDLAYYREECCFHDLPAKLEAAGLEHLNRSEASGEANEEFDASNKEIT